MDTTKILGDLYAEQSRITHAIAALESLSGTGTKGGATFEFGANAERKPSKMSADARAKIGAAQKKRWAKQKRAAARAAAQAAAPAVPKKAVSAKKATKKVAPKKVFAKKTAAKKAAPAHRMSAAARKRIGEATKARWAGKKAAAAPVAATSAATA